MQASRPFRQRRPAFIPRRDFSPLLYIIFNSLFLLAYVASALVQFNDPDPWAWVAIYLAAAGMCIAWLRRRLPRWYPAVLVVTCLLWMGSLLPSVVGQVSPSELFESISMKTRSVEEAREIGGLALVAVWAAVLMHRRAP